MKKRMVSIVLAISIVACLFAGNTFTTSFAGASDFSYTVSKGKAIIDTFNYSVGGSVNIPAKLGGYPVTAIGDYAFKDCDGIYSITIPKGVKTIGDYAFEGCDELKNVTMPSGLKTIGNYAFSNCKQLKGVTIPSGVTTIGYDAFYKCNNLISVKLPKSIKSIDSSAFGDCSNLKKVSYTGTIKTWCQIKFSGTISNPVSFAENLYINGKIVKNISIPKSIKSINDYTFHNCKCLESVKLPNTIKSIGKQAFGQCDNLKSITIPGSVKSIGEYAFYGCDSLASITIPGSVKSIGEYAFFDCDSLTSITIPNSVKSIGEDVFSSCSGLKNVKFKNGIKSISNGAFYNCDSLTSIKIPDSVKTIEESAFNDCNGLKSVTLGKNVKIIGERAFLSCDNLQSVYYNGTEAQKNEIEINDDNWYLLRATWKYGTQISLSKTSYTYNGKIKTPGVTVKDAAGTKLVKGKDYTVTYDSGRKNAGKYSVKVKIKNSYYFGSKTLNFKINPKGTTLSKLSKPKTKQIKVTWKKQGKQTTGYQIQYSKSKTFKSGNKTVTLTSNKTTSKTLTGLSKGKTYYVRIRTYKKDGNTKCYSAWSKAKSIKTK